jgi:hypothetical protein
MSISFVALAKSTGEVDPVLLKTCPKPTGTREGDIMLALVWAYEEEVTSAPTDWDILEQQSTSDAEGEPEVFNAYLYIKEAGASEPSSYTWETTTTTGPAPNRRVVIVSYRDVLLSGPTSEDRATHTENAGSNTLSLPNMDTSAVGRRLVLMAAVGLTTPTGSMPSPWIERLDEDGQFVFDRIMFITGATGTSTLTLSATITSWGFEVMLVPNPDDPGDRKYCASIDTQIN